MSCNDRKRTDGLGADPDTAIYLEPLGESTGRLFFVVPHCTRIPLEGFLHRDTEFDEPILLPRGKALATLRDSALYITNRQDRTRLS
jgi:hypothetical protein